MRPFGKVRPEETFRAGLLTIIVFVLLTAYYLLKTAREPLVLLQGGAEVKIYAEAVDAVLLLFVVKAYAEVARRVGRRKLLGIVYLFFTSNMLVFALLARMNVRIGVAFFIWVGLFSYTSIAQFWAFAADVYGEEQGKRLFPILGIGSSLGAVLGSRIAKSLIVLGPWALMLLAAALVVVCVALLAAVEARAAIATDAAPAPRAEAPLGGEDPFHLLARDRYLLLIGAMTVLLNWVNSGGEYVLDRTLLADVRAQGAGAQAFIGSFKASYFAWYNVLGVTVQMFVVSRVLARLGVRAALLFLPAVSLLGYGLFTLVPVLGAIRLAKIGENGLDYSIQNTARHALFLVSSRVEKYVGKTLVDTVGVRAGDLVSAGVVWVGVRAGMSTVGFSALNVVLTFAWVGTVVAIGREHARRSGEGEALVEMEPATS
jgi:AAA family ATP:ADP antiporter